MPLTVGPSSGVGLSKSDGMLKRAAAAAINHPTTVMLTVDITPKSPSQFTALAWDIFFASRGRGISQAVNLGWFDDPQAYFVTVRDGQQVVAGLGVRPVKCRGGEYVAGIVGLVCVHAAQRSRGHAQTALLAAISEAARLGIHDLILWTGQPAVYQRLGFMLQDGECSGWVSGDVKAEASSPPVHSDWPEPGSFRGLPAFALRGHRWSAPDATAVVIEDAAGPMLCEWHGSDDAVAQLLGHVMPARWRLHALAGDSLPGMLTAKGWTVDLAPSPLRMVKPLRAKQGPADPYRLRLLDRI